MSGVIQCEDDEGSERESVCGKSTSVKVALRIRPLLARETLSNARECIKKTANEPQVMMAGTHAFTFDYVFESTSSQEQLFTATAKSLVDGVLQGYNATILAYGQTGSGKTYTMGTGFDPDVLALHSSTGLLPRCISYLFEEISRLSTVPNSAPDFTISVQFTELYNEEVIDLLNETRASKSQIKIHEDTSGQIYLVNVASKRVHNSSETLDSLKHGALNRTTASTNMNDSSSRSHAIFTIVVSQNKLIDNDIESLSGKFHFVDLAGSERLKRTLATGDRAKEGIAINSGLLALGNVISALGDKSKKSTHVPYRDSKLTRLLQDSLGGNSRTIMIACVSPNELDFVETLNTMKYANRAKNIKNKVIINQDKSSRIISSLKEEIAKLANELMEYKRGVRKPEFDGDIHEENTLLLVQLESLKSKVQSKQDSIDKLTSQVARLQAVSIGVEENTDLTDIVTKYLTEIEDLRTKLYESESECEKLRSKQRVIMKNLSSPREDVSELLKIAKMEVSTHEIDDDEDDDDEEEENDIDYTELANLTQEINTKQRLIEELENSQFRLESLRNRYEEKLNALATKIRVTEQERDALITNKPSDKSGEYETKIANLQAELKKWNSAKKEHAKLIRNATNYENQIGKLKREVEEMKKLKVKLMNQVKAENAKAREMEKIRLREITQLKKESAKHEIRVRKLESDSKLKDQVLKRKLEEVEMLRKRNVKLSTGKSPAKGKTVWNRLLHNISKDVNSRVSVAALEHDMVGLISRRSELNGMLNDETLDCEQVDTINTNLEHINEKIKTLQEDIVGNTSNDTAPVSCAGMSTRDVTYVYDKFYELQVNNSVEINALENRVHQTQEVNKHLQKEVETLRELLQHMYMRKSDDDGDEPPQPMMPPPPPRSSQPRRRLTATTQELLGGSSENLIDSKPFNRNTRLTQSMKHPILTRQNTYDIIHTNINTETNESDNNTNSRALQRSVSEIASSKNTKNSRSWVTLSMSLEGHDKSIVCLAATQTVLVSGSKDATCRVWDLNTGKNVSVYDGFPHNVSSVCHRPDLNLIVTGSSYQLRFIDTRSHKTVKALTSSGLPWSNSAQLTSIPSLPQSTPLPRVNDLPHGEKMIYSVQSIRNYFFTSFGERTRIWDIRKLSPIGILQGKHNSSVMCITGTESHHNDVLITGSKDHCIKLYEYNHVVSPENITSTKMLTPPHYDGIECLLLSHQGHLFSGSRDTCIKKWNLNAYKMISTVTNAHNGWITGLANFPYNASSHNQEYMVSCSKDGIIKLWDTTKEFKEIAKHDNNFPLDCIASNNQLIFFANNNNISCSNLNMSLVTESRMKCRVGVSSGSRLLSPHNSPRMRRKYLNNPSDNIMTRSTGGLTDKIGVYKINELWLKHMRLNNNNLPANVSSRGSAEKKQTQYLD